MRSLFTNFSSEKSVELSERLKYSMSDWKQIMECPCCGKTCVKPAEEILADIDSMYMACPGCAPEPNLDKSSPLKALPPKVARCRSCGKAPLDAVMLDALRIAETCWAARRKRYPAKRGLSADKCRLSSGLPAAPWPKYSDNSWREAEQRCGREDSSHVPEIKGVILSKGVAGVSDSKKKPIENELLAGCDMRADVIQSMFGELVIYKSQSKVHIEFPRQSAPKMKIIEGLPIAGKDIIDGLCGPGTLGLMCALAGAKRVVLNDIWLPAIENAMLNLEVNQEILGIDEIEYPERPSDALGGEPVLACRATGACEIEVYHGDLTRLFSRAKPADLCLIDHFPGARITELQTACRCCKEIVII